MPDIEQDISFDDVTLDTVLGGSAPQKAEAEDVDPTITEDQEQPDGQVGTEEVVEETETAEEPEAETKPKVEGIREVRDAYERAHRRELELDASLKEVNQVFEELGADAKTVSEIVKGYGGLEQLKVGTQLYQLITDASKPAEELLKEAHEIIPETTQSLVLYIAGEVEKDLSASYQQKMFGRELTEADIGRVRDFLDFGVTSEAQVPQDLLHDEFGEPLPEKTQAAIRAMWNRNSASEQKLKELSARVDKQLSSIDESQASKVRDSYMAEAFAPISEVVSQLGLDKTEDKSQFAEDLAAMETLTFKFFSMNPAADKALMLAMDTLGKKDASSRAKHLDATKQVQKYAKIAAGKAARYFGAKTSVTKTEKTANIEKGESVKSGVTAASKAPVRQADDWSDISVQTLKLSGKKRR